MGHICVRQGVFEKKTWEHATINLGHHKKGPRMLTTLQANNNNNWVGISIIIIIIVGVAVTTASGAHKTIKVEVLNVIKRAAATPNQFSV
jgi:hypothetical protein